MIAQILKSISDRAIAQMPQINQVTLFNEQYNYPQEELPLAPPSLLVEFGQIAWQNIGRNIQRGETTIRMHMVVDYVMPEMDSNNNELLQNYDGSVLSYMEDLFTTFHGFTPTDNQGNALAQSLVRINTFPQPRPDGLHVWITEFQTILLDQSAKPPQGEPVNASPNFS